MIDRVVSICLRKRFVVVMVALMLAAFGYYSWTKMAVEAYPDIGDVTAQVTTQAPGLASEEVEQQITIPLERALAGTPGLQTMRSSSTFGLSLITLIFRDGAEDYLSRQRVMERMGQVNLPSGIQPGLDPVTGADRRDIPLHSGVGHQEPHGAFGDPAMDRHPGPRTGARRGRTSTTSAASPCSINSSSIPCSSSVWARS